jgi:hypothetical protein
MSPSVSEAGVHTWSGIFAIAATVSSVKVNPRE